MSLLITALLILGAGVLLLRRSRRQRAELGLPEGEVVAQDHLGEPLATRLLTSTRYGLRGTPDCLIRTLDGIVPVELKRSARPPRHGVYQNHLVQVLAYALLVSESYGEPVPYALVLYRNNEARKVLLTEENLRWVETVIDAVRLASAGGEKSRSHRLPGRCHGCGLRESCGQSIAARS